MAALPSAPRNATSRAVAGARWAAVRGAAPRGAMARAPRGGWRWPGNFWRALGPGVVTGAADDDPSGIATYSIAGARFGTGFLWAALLTWPLMAAVQSMC